MIAGDEGEAVNGKALILCAARMSAFIERQSLPVQGDFYRTTLDIISAALLLPIGSLNACSVILHRKSACPSGTSLIHN
jgi:hypothetical protein